MSPISGKNILLVEDEALIALEQARVLKKHGYAVQTVHSGDEAVALVRSGQGNIDLILMDVDLGKGMDGTEAAEIILKEQDIPVVFLSSHTEPEIVEKAERINAYGYVVKNTGETVLLVSIRLAFRLHAAHRHIQEQVEEQEKVNEELNAVVEELEAANTEYEAANEELQSSEEELRLSEEKYRTLVESLPVGIFRNTPGPEGAFVMANSALARIHGYTSLDEFVGRRVADLYLNREDRSSLSGEMESRGFVQGREMMFRRKDGSVFLGSVTARAFRDEKGNTLYYDGWMEDITDRRRMEDNLRERIKELRCLYNISHILETGSLDPERAFREITGFLPEGWHYPGKTGSRLEIGDEVYSSPGFAESPWMQQAYIIAKEEIAGRVMISFNGDLPAGGETPFLPEEEDLLKGIAEMLGNFLERQRVIAHMEETEERLRLLSDNLNDGLVYQIDTGTEGDIRTFTYISAGVERLHEVTAEDALENAAVIYDQLIGEDRLLVAEREAEAVAAMKPFSAEARVQLPSGITRWRLFTSAPRRLSDGRLVWDGIEIDITDRKAAEEGLRQSELRYRSVVNRSIIGVAVVDDRSRYVYVNEEFCRVCGYTEDELVGRNFDFLLTEESRQTAVDRYVRRQKGEDVPDRYQFTFIRKGGDVRIGEVQSSVYLDVSGRPNSLIQARDITESIRSAEALRESEAKYRTLIENSSDIIYSLTAEGVFTYVSPNWTALLGHNVSEVVGRSFEPFVHPEDVEACVRFLGKIVATGEKQGAIEYRVLNKNGDWRWHASNASAKLDEEGRFLEYIGIARDITERKRADEMLGRKTREQDVLLRASRAVLENREFARAARVIFDLCREMTGATAGYVALLSPGGEENELLFLEAGGRPCSVDPDLPMPVRGLREVAYRTARPVFDNDFENSRWKEFMPGGHVRLDNVLFAPLVVEERAVGLIGMANKEGGFNEDDARLAGALGDIAAIALINSRNLERLETSIKDREVLLKELQHRVKNNLNVVSSLLGLEMATLEDERPRQVFQNMRSRILSMSVLYERLYRSSELEDIDLGEYLKGIAVSLAETYAAQSGAVRITAKMEPLRLDLKRTVPLGLVVNELVTNSLKYAYPAGSGGELRLSLERIGGNVHLSVSDEGPGFPEGAVFGAGEGMGLKLVEMLARQIEGKVAVRRGKGAVVQIIFREEG